MFWVWFYIKQLQSLKHWLIAKIPLLFCQQVMGRVLFYMIQRKFQLGRMVIVIFVTPLNLYNTEPGATFVWTDMQIFPNFNLNPPFFSLNPLLNKFMIRACCICWSRYRTCSSNMVCTYFRVLFLACDGRRRGDPNESKWCKIWYILANTVNLSSHLDSWKFTHVKLWKI